MIKLEGSWDEVSHILSNLRDNLLESLQDAVEQTAQEGVKTIQGHIDSQDLGWVPLTPSTIKTEGNSLIYIDSGQLKGSFSVNTKMSGDTTSSTIAIAGTQPSGVPTSQVLSYMEFGTTRQPPRPLIRPSMNELKPKFLRIVKGSIRDLIRR